MTFLDVVVSTHGSPEGRGGAAWTAGANRWAGAVEPLVRDALRKKAPVGQGSNAGSFRDSIVPKRSGSAGTLSVQFGSGSPIAPYIVDGTRPHVIQSRGPWALRNRETGQVFGRMVNHPGTKANPFARKAVEPMLPEVRALFSTIMGEAMGGMP